MTRDANQIARETERREEKEARVEPRGAVWRDGVLVHPEPRRGQFTVLSDFGDDAYVVSRNINVTVEITPSGLVVMVYPDGAKTIFKPVEGWCMIFEPHDAGE